MAVLFGAPSGVTALNCMLQNSQTPSWGVSRTIRSFRFAMPTVSSGVDRLSNSPGFKPAVLNVSAIARCCALWRSLGTNCSEMKSLCAPMPRRSGQPLCFMSRFYAACATVQALGIFNPHHYQGALHITRLANTFLLQQFLYPTRHI